METKICQSCGMPINSNNQLSTNKDGTINEDYCKYCYQDGEFIDKVSMAEYIEMCSQYGEQAGMTNAEMKKHCEKLFPTLKRWKSDLSTLPNIGTELERKLKVVGIETAEDLKSLGSKATFLKLKDTYPNVCLVHLQALQGAIDNLPLDQLPEATKQDLKEFSDSLK